MYGKGNKKSVIQGDIITTPKSDFETGTKYIMVISQTCDLLNGDIDSISLVPIVPLDEIYLVIKQKKESENGEKKEKIKKAIAELLPENHKKRRDLEQKIRDIDRGLSDSIDKKIKAIKKFESKTFFYLTQSTKYNIEKPHVAKLDRIISIKKDEFEKILFNNKVCSLTSPWREKLGWRMGNLFNRVAVDWKKLQAPITQT